MKLQLLYPIRTALLLACATVNASAASLYVSIANAAPAPPYASWSSAATNIQDAIDAANVGDTVVVTNGLYATGGQAWGFTVTNRIAVLKAVTVRSVNGPDVTVICGQQGIRCALLTNGAVLSGFTLTNGVLREDAGAGVLCLSTKFIFESSAVVSNCVIVGNSTTDVGGGVAGGTFYDCTLMRNFTDDDGGGAYFSTLNHCTLSGNGANEGGGGAYSCTLNYCRLTNNWSSDSGKGGDQGGGGAAFCTLNHCTLMGNSAANSFGGGASSSTLNDCLLTGNSARFGGGVAGGTLQRCTLVNNFAEDFGGGVDGGKLTDCNLEGNFAIFGGGTAYCDLTNCTLRANQALITGGGAYGERAYATSLHKCILTGNSAGVAGGGSSGNSLVLCTVSENSALLGGGCADSSNVIGCLIVDNHAATAGGGTYECVLESCTVVGNSSGLGGGISRGQANNSILYYNSATNEANYFLSQVRNSCTTPADVDTICCGNISDEPAFVNIVGGNYRLRPGSPCIDMGVDSGLSISIDLEGNPRPLDGNADGIAAFDMGAYEFNSLFFTSITKVGNKLRLSWFDSPVGMQLQSSPSLVNPVWTNVPFDPGTNGLELLAAGNVFFRLSMP